MVNGFFFEGGFDFVAAAPSTPEELLRYNTRAFSLMKLNAHANGIRERFPANAAKLVTWPFECSKCGQVANLVDLAFQSLRCRFCGSVVARGDSGRLFMQVTNLVRGQVFSPVRLLTMLDVITAFIGLDEAGVAFYSSCLKAPGEPIKKDISAVLEFNLFQRSRTYAEFLIYNN